MYAQPAKVPTHFSSEDFERKQRMDNPADKMRLQQFSGQKNLSSAEYFGRDEGIGEEVEGQLGDEAMKYARQAVEKGKAFADKAKSMISNWRK